VFNELRGQRMSPESRTRLRFLHDETFGGEVTYMEANYCMIARTGDGARIYCNRDDLSRTEWDSLTRGCRVRFQVAFCMSGVRAHKLQKV
jgi:hypothetical protein